MTLLQFCESFGSGSYDKLEARLEQKRQAQVCEDAKSFITPSI